MHGLGGYGSDVIGSLQDIAEQREALIVAPNAWYMAWAYCIEAGVDTNCLSSSYEMLLSSVFKQIYRNVLLRESRDTIPVYLTGFSAGGQCVTRYILIRQLVPDSIPIKMAVSVNPAFYTVCLDSLNGNEMQYPCGISTKGYYHASCHYPPPFNIDTLMIAFCNEHIIQYYNENYGVLIGTADTAYDVACGEPALGTNRYERAQFFYNYSNTNAVTRGTTLLWQYDTVSNIGHDGWAMYNTKVSPLDSFTIAETMLFDTPYHNVPKLAPVADFEADTTVVFLPNANVQFINKSTPATNYVWSFGDSTTSTAVNPAHQYTFVDTFTVKLTAINGTGCENTAKKWDYIIVKDAIGVDENIVDGLDFSVYPNPNKGIFNIVVKTIEKTDLIIELMNIQGQILYRFNSCVKRGRLTHQYKIDVSEFARGIYYLKVNTGNEIIIKKVVVI